MERSMGHVDIRWTTPGVWAALKSPPAAPFLCRCRRKKPHQTPEILATNRQPTAPMCQENVINEVLEQPAEPTEVEEEAPPPSDPRILEKAHKWESKIVGLSRDLRVETPVGIAALTEIHRRREAAELLAAVNGLREQLAAVKTVPWWQRW
jgi:hypothetical protein